MLKSNHNIQTLSVTRITTRFYKSIISVSKSAMMDFSFISNQIADLFLVLSQVQPLYW